MFWKTNQYTNNMEILANDANLVTLSKTLLSTGVTADENGKKYVLAGALIDKDGNVVKQNGSGGSETLSTTPIGVLFTNVEVTNGDMPCSLVVEGYLRADRVLDGFAEAAVTAIKKALPEIKFI